MLSFIVKSFIPVATKSDKSALKEAASVLSCLKLISFNFMGSMEPIISFISGIPIKRVLFYY